MLEAVRVLPYNHQLRLFLAIAEYESGNQIESLKQANYAYQLSPSAEAVNLVKLIKNKEELPDFRR